MLRLRFVLTVSLFCLLTAPWARATSIFVEGIILEVSADGKTYKVKGYDHYNHTRYNDKIAEISVKIAADPVFVLDNRIVKREIALVPGRWAYAIGSSAGAGMTIVLSEPASRIYGRVLSVEGNKLKVKIVQGADAYEQEIALDAKPLFRGDGKEAAREAVLAEGKTVRVAPARKQTVLAFTPQAVVTELPKGFSGASWGVLKDPAGAKLAVFKGAEVAEYSPEGKKLTPVHDILGDVCHGGGLKANAAAGWPAVALGWQKRGPGKVDWYLVTQWPDERRVEGVVKSFAGGKLVLNVLSPDGAKETTATLDAGAAVKLDNKDAAADEALKAGNYVSIYAVRAQVIESVSLPEKK